MLGFVRNDLWRQLGAAANARGQYLAEAMCMDARIQWPYAPRANMLFPKLPRSVLQNLATSGVAFNNWGNRDIGSPDEMLLTRFVCDWSLPRAQIDAFSFLVFRRSSIVKRFNFESTVRSARAPLSRRDPRETTRLFGRAFQSARDPPSSPRSSATACARRACRSSRSRRLRMTT